MAVILPGQGNINWSSALIRHTMGVRDFDIFCYNAMVNRQQNDLLSNYIYSGHLSVTGCSPNPGIHVHKIEVIELSARILTVPTRCTLLLTPPLRQLLP
jgi:hypothetical protein